jgi:integrase/recombinase XerD
MKTEAVDLVEGRVRVMGKGSRERVVPLGTEAVRWLRRYLEEVRPALAGNSDTAALWLGKNGKALSGEGLQQILLRYRGAPGIVTQIGLHSIRRACVTHMLRRGANPAAIQLLLGHADMSHLNQYLRLSAADVKEMHERSRVGQ